MAAVVVALAAAAGCGTTKQSGTARTGTEQLLLTNAWDSALRKVDFRPLTGVPVFLDTQYISAVDQGWIISSIRQSMLAQGVLLRPKIEQAQWVVEARVGVYGTDSYNWMIGIPQISVPPTLTGVPTGTVPEMPLIKKADQQAIAKLAMFAYDRATGRIVWNPATALDTANAKDVYIAGAGPIQSGSIRRRDKKIGINIPLLADPVLAPADPAVQPMHDPLPGMAAPTLALPASAADLESFAP